MEDGAQGRSPTDNKEAQGRSPTKEEEECFGSVSPASSASSSFRSESLDAVGDHRIMMSELEEIPSLRWLSPSFWSSSSRSRRSDADTSSALAGDWKVWLPSFWSSNRRTDAKTSWEEQLPPDYRDILARAVVPVRFSSFEDLYARLCEPLRIDRGQKSFWLERSTGKKCYMLSVNAVDYQRANYGGSPRYQWADDGGRPRYQWADDGGSPRYSYRTHMPESRFGKAVNIPSSWGLFRVNGEIDARDLSPNTTYAAYLVFKGEGEEGEEFRAASLTTRIGVEHHTSERTVWLGLETINRHSYEGHTSVEGGREMQPVTWKHRADGWVEVELGEFSVEGGDSRREVWVRVKGDTVDQQNGGSEMVIEGMELRPK